MAAVQSDTECFGRSLARMLVIGAGVQPGPSRVQGSKGLTPTRRLAIICGRSIRTVTEVDHVANGRGEGSR